MFVSLTMLVLLSFSVLLVRSVFGGESFDDKDTEEKVKDVIASVNAYIDRLNVRELQLPDIGLLLIELKDGKIGQFDSIKLDGTPQITRHQDNGTVLYNFGVNLDLDLLLLQYQFRLNLPGPLAQGGQFVVMPQKHSIETKGVVVISSENDCEARLHSVEITRLESFQIDIQPNIVPFMSSISEFLLNFLLPKLLPLTNLLLKITTISPCFQNNIDELICKGIKNYLD